MVTNTARRTLCQRLGWLFTIMAIAGTAFAAAPTVSTWTGGGVAGDWSDAANWDAGVPDGRNFRAVIPDGTGPLNFAVGVPSGVLNRLTTGDGAVTMPGGLNFWYETLTGGNQGGALFVGTGGLTFGGGLVFPHGNTTISAAGNLIATQVSYGNTAPLVETVGSGSFEIASFGLPISGNPFFIRAWLFANNTPTLIWSTGFGGGNYRFIGTPTFSAGYRADWSLGAGFTDGRNYYDLNGYTLLADELALTGSGTPFTRWSRLINDDSGGTVDANSLIIGKNGYLSCVLQLSNTDVILGGAGTIYDNRSASEALFDITDNVTVTLDPTGGAANLDSGSDDRSSCALDPADWEDNFAFDLIQIGAGDVITLVGDANVSGGPNALYARTIVGLGAGATLALNGHNVYLLEAPTGVTFDTSGGGAVYAPPVCSAALEEAFLLAVCGLQPPTSLQGLASAALPIATNLVATAGACDACVQHLLDLLP